MKLLRIREVMEITGLSRMTIYRMEKAGDFPSRRRLGTNSVAWIEGEVNAWVEARPSIATAKTRQLRTQTYTPNHLNKGDSTRGLLRARTSS